MEMTMEDLKKAINDTMADGLTKTVAEQLAPLTAKLSEVERKAIFAVEEGNFVEGHIKTSDGSVINPAGFTKAMLVPGAYKMSDADFGHSVLSNGGIFQKLSPCMEQFAKMLKGKMNPNRMQNLGFDGSKYKELVLNQVKAITGMSEGVNADGGFTVPVEYASTVIEFAIQQSAILSSVQRVSMKSNSAKWPRLAQTDNSFFGGFAFDWLDEGATKQNHKVTFEQVTFTAHKVAALCVLTDELIEDSLIAIVNYVTALAARAWMYELENMVIDGSGVGQPLGISNDPVVVANAVARVTAGQVKDTDLFNLEGAMNENFTNLTWMLRRETLTKIRALKDTVGQPIFHENWATFGGTPTRGPSILSYPFHVSRNVSSIGHRGDIILGDLSHYMLAMRKDMTIDVSPYPYFTTDETVLRFVARVDGKCGSPYAFKMLQGTGS